MLPGPLLLGFLDPVPPGRAASAHPSTSPPPRPTPAGTLLAAAPPPPLHGGRDLGVVLGLPRKLKVKVEGRPERFFKKVRADVAFVCTSSHLKETKPQG